MEIMEYTIEKLADELGVSRITISNWDNYKNAISKKHLDEFYNFVFKKGLRLYKIKERFYREDIVKWYL